MKDKDVIEELEAQLWSALISSEKHNMWLAIPDIVDWSNVAGFSYRAEAEGTDIQEILYLEKFSTLFEVTRR